MSIENVGPVAYIAGRPPTSHTAKGQVIAIVNSGSDGSYAISLPPGSYTLVVATLGAFPRCPQAAAVVPPLGVAVVDIDCDTGIR